MSSVIIIIIIKYGNNKRDGENMLGILRQIIAELMNIRYFGRVTQIKQN